MVSLESGRIYPIKSRIIERKHNMQKLIDFIISARKGTAVVAPIASGVTVVHNSSSHCQCDCRECAGGDTTDDRD
jgi:hypothetical protein